MEKTIDEVLRLVKGTKDGNLMDEIDLKVWMRETILISGPNTMEAVARLLINRRIEQRLK